MRDDGRPLRGLIAVLAVAACGGDAPARGPALQITGETVKVRAGDPLPATSAIFDGETVQLRAARGETLGLVVWRAEEGEVPVALAIDGAAVQGYRVAHHTVTRPSTSMWGPSGGAGAWPDRLERVDGAVPTTRAAYFEIAGEAAGTRRGRLTVGAREIPVELAVDDVVLPAIADAPRVWAYYDPREVWRAAGVDGDAGFEAERRLVELLRRHGVAASPDLRLEDWPRREPLLRGLAWIPVKLPDDPLREAEEIRGWIAALAGTGQVPFAIPIDEPRRLIDKARVRVRAGRVRVVGGGRFLYAVTDTPHPIYHDLVDVYISPFAVSRAAPSPARWTYNGTPPFAGAMILDTDGAAMRTWGWIAWRWKVPLWYVWDAAYWSDRHNARRRGVRGLPPSSPLDSDAVSFDDGEDHGNLDGVLAFWTPDGPAPTLRLAALRRGLQDRALLELVERCAGRDAAEAIAADLVPAALADAGRPGDSRPGAWPTAEPRWEAARHALLELARSRCAAP